MLPAGCIVAIYYYTIWLVIFVGLIFRDFVGLYFHGIPPLIT